MLHRSFADRRGSALNKYSQNLGHLTDRAMSDGRLHAMRRKAEHEAADARAARAAAEEELAQRLMAQSRLAYLASHDPLTALPNRNLLTDNLAVGMAKAAGFQRKVALLYLDLDHFKDVNDSLGHKVGDLLLQAVARRIENELRPGETVARIGGDEFAVILVGLDNAFQAQAIGERLVGSLSQAFNIAGAEVRIGASIGITVYPDDGADADLLHRNADLALYRAKGCGRNQCYFFDATLNQEVTRRSALEQALRDPSVMAQMYLTYQPQVDLVTGRLTGAESLLRWRHPLLGQVSPEEFIPLVERSGLIMDLGKWVLHESCRQAAEWATLGLPPLVVAVNVSPAQFRGGHMPRVVEEMLNDTGLPGDLLEIEITESGVMFDVNVAADALHSLHDLGVKLAIDDFGTGHSSLSYLRRLPVDRIKIDRSFVTDLETEDGALIARTIVTLAHNLRMEVVAEGVENLEQVRFLQGSGCDYAQGYYYGRPLLSSDLVEAVRNSQTPEISE